MTGPNGTGVRITWALDRTALAHELGEELLEEWLEDVTDDCLTLANETAPIETGAMIASGFAEVEGMEGQVGYDTPYVVAQHEDPTLHHDPGRRDHWLSKTIDENSDRWTAHAAIIAARKFRD